MPDPGARRTPSGSRRTPDLLADCGLRDAPDVYRSGTHLDEVTVALSRERVRRARLGPDLLARSGSSAAGSAPGAAGLAVAVAPAPRDRADGGGS